MPTCEICNPVMEKPKTVEQYNRLCGCGHKHGVHWYFSLGEVKNGNCRECACRKIHAHKAEDKEDGSDHS
jgi:hypothetical protein